MHFGTKSYLKSTRNHTTKHAYNYHFALHAQEKKNQCPYCWPLVIMKFTMNK
jgi:hypothetical protein